MTDIQRELLRFARLHDWGYDAQANDDGTVTVGCDAVHMDTGVWTREYDTVSTMQELRDVAGY